MTFKLRVSKVEYRGDELAISGRIIEGSFFGPEAVTICGRDGKQITVGIVRHFLDAPEGWPVLPSHETILSISVCRPVDFKIDETQPVVGHGCLLENSNRENVSHLVEDPAFLAMQLSNHLGDDDVEELSELYFGISADKLDRFYKTEFGWRFDAGVWPYLAMSAGEKRFFEIEFATGIEYQERYWAVDSTTSTGVLLGYNSGHFSLPALRVEEVLWFQRVASDQLNAGAMSLLLLAACYINEATPELKDFVSTCFAGLPGFKAKTSQNAAEAFLEHITVRDVRWEYVHDLGWINNWPYSQRNPSSTMRVLEPEDYSFIRRFFAGMER